MIKHSENSDLLKQFRKSPLPVQRTFRTPLNNLKPFVGEILTAIGPVQGATLAIDHIIFEPKNLNALVSQASIPTGNPTEGWTLEVRGEAETRNLLTAGLSDWLDFLFIPDPRHLVIYADHDEYTTFFGMKDKYLTKIREALTREKFEEVQDYRRTF